MKWMSKAPQEIVSENLKDLWSIRFRAGLYDLAVDSGGWFKSKLFLLPVGHAQLDRERDVIVADLTRERVEQFPGFDKDEFQEFGQEELGRFNNETSRACNIAGAEYLVLRKQAMGGGVGRP